jgi:GNAT superfamily N-acetyltransferase
VSPDEFLVRQATVEDADVIARHRALMFSEMHDLVPERTADLLEQTIRYLRVAMPAGEYVGWMVCPVGEPRTVVAGAGAQVRHTLPQPRGVPGVSQAPQAIVLNVYTETAWRRRGLAELLMQRVIHWAGDAGMHTLVLHASTAGRPLYERIGFTATNEMRYTGALGKEPA